MEIDAVGNEYFASYEDLEIHRLMLEDYPRTYAYKQAILNNKSYFKNKVVMDVGCGTGILSLFCAQAGAKKVIAVEASELAKLAKEIVKENNFENVIEVIHSKVEDVVLPDNEKVDVIVSEWMGFFLLHEGMLDSVITARDKFLKEDGKMFPESATIYIAPCSVPLLYKNWEQVHGVSMSVFAKHLRVNKNNKPEIMTVQDDDILGKEVALGWIDLNDITISELDSLSIQHVVGAKKQGQYQGLCIWFDCNFPNLSEERDAASVVLSTSPQSPPTHWKQTVIVLPQELDMDEGEPIAFQLDINRDKNNNRRYNLLVTLLDPDTVEHPLPCTCHMTKCILIKTFMLEHPERGESIPLKEQTLKNSDNILEDDNIDDDDIE